MSRGSDPTEQPLRPAVFHILLALSKQELHGLGIADEAERASAGVVELAPGTLYRSLAEMTAYGLVQVLDVPPEGADPRRKYYRLTEPGRALLSREAERLAHLVEVARGRNVLPEPA